MDGHASTNVFSYFEMYVHMDANVNMMECWKGK